MIIVDDYIIEVKSMNTILVCLEEESSIFNDNGINNQYNIDKELDEIHKENSIKLIIIILVFMLTLCIICILAVFYCKS